MPLLHHSWYHDLLVMLKVESFGTGQKVKLPGQSAQEPVIYDFGTPYMDMLKDLQQRAEEHYRKRGILHMLERNASIKSAPERWQTAGSAKLSARRSLNLTYLFYRIIVKEIQSRLIRQHRPASFNCHYISKKSALSTMHVCKRLLPIAALQTIIR